MTDYYQKDREEQQKKKEEPRPPNPRQPEILRYEWRDQHGIANEENVYTERFCYRTAILRR